MMIVKLPQIPNQAGAFAQGLNGKGQQPGGIKHP